MIVFKKLISLSLRNADGQKTKRYLKKIVPAFENNGFVESNQFMTSEGAEEKKSIN